MKRERDESLEPEPVSADDAAAAAAAVELETARRERDELREHYQRALADAENARKRHQREMTEARQYAIAEFARELLPVLDNFERALAGAPAGAAEDPVTAGVRLVRDQLLHVFKNHGVEPVAALGQPFDPNLHEAIQQDPRADVAPGTVTEELVKGYRLRDRLLRASMVKVASRPAETDEEPAADGPEESAAAAGRDD